MISFNCDCGASYTVADHFAGKKSRCKRCSNKITVPSTNKEPEWFEETAPREASRNKIPVIPNYQTVSETRTVPPPFQPIPTPDEVALGAVLLFSIIGFIGIYGIFAIYAAGWMGWHASGSSAVFFSIVACWILALPLGFALSCLGLKNGWNPVRILLTLVAFASHTIYYFS